MRDPVDQTKNKVNTEPVQRRFVLIVEDEQEFADLLARHLASEGYSPIICPRVPEAMLKLQKQRFHCILLDMRLEHGSGEKVIEELRDSRSNFNHKTPIIVISAYLDGPLVKRIRADIADILVKPFDFKALTQRLESLPPAA